MLDVFIPSPMPGKRLVPFIADAPQKGNRLFQDLPPGSYRGIYHAVDDPAQAAIIILPHEYALLRKYPQYLANSLALARRAGKRVLISAYQDSTEPLAIDHSVVLRSSAYRTTVLPNEIVMPAYIEDLSAAAPLGKGEQPIVGFMGKAGFASVKEAAKYLVRNYVLRRGANREGIYFRRRALSLLQADARVDLHATLRTRFSANAATIELDPEEARESYLRAIRETQFTLAPRGDGNYSLRFYETLALGRIPVLIDTDLPLPLEDRIAYDEFIVRVPWRRLGDIAEIVWEAWETRDEDALMGMQTKARAAYENYLSMPAFLRTVLTRDFLDRMP